MRRKACPVLKFKVTALTPAGFKAVQKKLPDGTTGVRVSALAGDRHVAQLSMSVETVADAHPIKRHIKGNDFLQPGWVEVDASYRRCGLGTKLYETAAQVAKASKLSLVSSYERSEMSEGFWAKQAKKGRAVCLPNQPGEYSSKGRYNPETRRVDWPEELSERDAWPCWRYVLKAGKTDLSGPKRRRRR